MAHTAQKSYAAMSSIASCMAPALYPERFSLHLISCFDDTWVSRFIHIKEKIKEDDAHEFRQL